MTKPRSLTRWLFNPFTCIAGFRALLIGLAVIMLTAFIASHSNTHFDGVLDMHTGPGSQSTATWFFFAEGLTDWICMSVVLLICGLLVARSSFRLIDVLGTQASARAPHLLTAIVTLPAGFKKVTEYLIWKTTQQGSTVTIETTDILFFALAMIITLAMTVWMVALMYRAYAVSCNTKGPRAVGSFIAAITIAEILSKIALWQFATHC